MKQNGMTILLFSSLAAVAIAFIALSPVYALEVNTSIKTGAGANAGSAADVSVETSAEADASVGGNEDGTTTNEVVIGAGDVEVVVITRADIDSDAEVSASASPSTVSTDADISGYVAAQMAADSNVSKMESSRSRVTVTYPQKAMLFSVVPVTVQATATVLADGTVDVRYPWFAFLMVTNEADLESEIESRVSTLPSSSLTATMDASLELSARAQAELIDTVRVAMESELSAATAVAASI